jgi:hypothetical protein
MSNTHHDVIKFKNKRFYATWIYHSAEGALDILHLINLKTLLPEPVEKYGAVEGVLLEIARKRHLRELGELGNTSF